MIQEILLMFGLTVLQNASFTLVSRARNSNSLTYHTIASVLSNGIWLLVIRNVVANFDNWILMVTYLIGAVCGSVTMHYISMHYFENKKDVKKPSHLSEAFKYIIEIFNKERKTLEKINASISDPIQLINQQIKGFKFERREGITYNSKMKDCEGKIGKISNFNERNNSYTVYFEDGEDWNYPAEEIKNHLV